MFEYGLSAEAYLKDLSAMEAELKALPGALAAYVLGDGNFAAAKVVRDEAKATGVFKDVTGELRKSISRSRVKGYFNGRKVKGLSARVTAGNETAHYAHIIEGGSVKLPAHPFLYPALTNTANEQLSAFGQAVRLSYNKLAATLLAGTSNSKIRRLAAL